MTRNDYWRGKRAVVTGGSAGLGLELARALCDRGAHVVVAARDRQRLDHAAAELPEEASAVTADVTRDEDVESLVERARSRLGGIDLWANCAGRSARGTVADTSLQEFQALWEVNFLATVRCAQAALPWLAQSRGHLVNIGSLASKFAPRFLGAYPASKFAVAALSQQLRLEWQEQGVHVLLVCPGPLRREDAGQRYAAQAATLPEQAQAPGGGARLKGIDPQRLASDILRACQRRRGELVVPWRARLLAATAQLFPAWGDWLLRKSTA